MSTYLDNNATTRTAPEVVQAMIAYMQDQYGNPSSTHCCGRPAQHAIELARRRIASLLGCLPDEIVFTSGGSESDNTAIRSAVRCHPDLHHIVACPTEHPAVLQPIEDLQQGGYQVTWLRPEPAGHYDVAKTLQAIRPDTLLVAMMAANNETGVINPVAALGQAIRHQRGGRSAPLFLVDATQAVGKVPVNFRHIAADYMVFSGHKFHGPKGIGALIVDQRAPFASFILGGSQENGRRAGTENVPGIVGLGTAVDLAQTADTERAWAEIRRMRTELEGKIKQLFGHPNVIILGETAVRVPNTTLAGIRGLASRQVQQQLADQNIAVGTGSACSCLHDAKPSNTVKLMGTPPPFQTGVLRFSFCRYDAPSLGGDPEVVNRVLRALTACQAHPVPS